MSRLGTAGLRVAEVCVVIAVAGLLLGQFLGIPLVVGFVETGSMAPTMNPGDGFIALPPVLTGGVDEGDVVTFQPTVIGEGRLTTHRVVDETETGYITRGDANPFTDQQSGEPPVPRDRVVAEALQVGGSLVVVPGLGASVSAVRQVLRSIGAPVGLGANQVVASVLAGVLAVSVLEERRPERDTRTDRVTRRARGYSGPRIVVGCVVVVVFAATLGMTATAEPMTVPYDSVDSGGDGRGIPAGESENASVDVRNTGVVPMVVLLQTSDGNAELGRQRLVIGPRATRTVNLTIAAPSQTGRYEVTVDRRQYLSVLPPGVLARIAGMGHWAAVLAVDAVVAVVTAALSIRLVGLGRLRLRSERHVPATQRARRWLRSVYRDR